MSRRTARGVSSSTPRPPLLRSCPSAATGSQASRTARFQLDRSFPLPELALERDGNGKLVRRYGYGPSISSPPSSMARSRLPAVRAQHGD